ncbi:hypothetical protein pb186bvf_005490 [Paramecium bursaria]
MDKTKPPMTLDEKFKIVLFTILYCIVGFPVGFTGSITLLLAEKKAPQSDLAMISLCMIPFSCKLLFAPFLDSYYSDTIGQRKSYIVPCLYMSAACFLLMGHYSVTGWIEELNILPIILLQFTNILVVSITIIAIQGWVIADFQPHFVHVGGSCMAIGTALGSLIGYTVTLNIISAEFCQEYLGTSNELITLDKWCYVLGITSIIIVSLVQIFVKEHIQAENIHSLRSVFASIKKIISNKNVQIFIIYLLTRKIGFSPVLASNSINLIQMGFPAAQYAQMSLFLQPGLIITSIYVGKYLPRGQEFTWIIYSYLGMFAITVGFYIYIQNFIHLGGYNQDTYLILVGLMLIDGFISALMHVCQLGFILRISDPIVGGTYATMLTSITSFGQYVSYAGALFLLDFVPYKILVIFGWIYALIYIAIMKEKLIDLQFKDLSSWRI